MYRVLSRLYKAVDKYAFSRLPDYPQRFLKASLLALAKLVVRRRLRGLRVDALMFSAPLKGNEWKRPVLPEWVRDEMRHLAKTVDPLMHPDSPSSRAMAFCAVPYANERPGDIYANLRRQVQDNVDIILVVPRVKQDEAGFGVRHFVTALQQDMHKRVLVIATEPQESSWGESLTEECQFLSAGEALSVCSTGEREVILTRLLMQLSPSTIHIMDSLLGWQAIKRFGKAIRYSSRVYASLHCDYITDAGYVDGYARQFLAECSSNLDGIITDNDRNHRRWTQEIGVPESLFSVILYPVSIPDEAGRREAEQGHGMQPRILWAGRRNRQNCPDILAAIAARMPDVQFDIHWINTFPPGRMSIRMLKSLSNVHLHGDLACFDKMVRDDHVAALYTAAWDGMPNVILEAAAANLPVVAPRIGGIEDFISEEWLVADARNVDEYIERLRQLIDDPALRSKRIRAQRENLTSSHTWQKFTQSIKRVPHYLDTRDASTQWRRGEPTSMG